MLVHKHPRRLIACGGAAFVLFLWAAHSSTLLPLAVGVEDHPHFYSSPSSLHQASPNVSSNSANPQADADVELAFLPTHGPPPRMTIVTIWSPQARDASYLPNFFASAGANPLLDVLFLKIDKYGLNDGSCERQQATGIDNVRELCISMDEYWDLHVDWLCEEWVCDATMRARAREVIANKQNVDRVNSLYRPFRAEVFVKYMLPGVPLWAWSDLDVVLGNFARAFPWDLAPHFDVLIAGWPTNLSDILIFMPGHLTAFRRAPEVAREFQRALPGLATFDGFVGDAFAHTEDAAEEGEYSHALFIRTELRFVRLYDAMVDTNHHLSTLNGVFGIEDDFLLPSTPEHPTSDRALSPEEVALLSARQSLNAALASLASVDAGAHHTFTAEGIEAPVVLREAPESDGLWFPAEYAVRYDSSPLAAQFPGNGWKARRFVMRRERGGPVVERFEPLKPIAFDVPGMGAEGAWLREGLYTHLQGEKYAPWWALPPTPLVRGEVLYFDKDHGAHLWDADANLLWQSPRLDA